MRQATKQPSPPVLSHSIESGSPSERWNQKAHKLEERAYSEIQEAIQALNKIRCTRAV